MVGLEPLSEQCNVFTAYPQSALLVLVGRLQDAVAVSEGERRDVIALATQKAVAVLHAQAGTRSSTSS